MIGRTDRGGHRSHFARRPLILIGVNPLMHNSTALAIVPETDAVDVVVTDPDGVVMAVRDRIARVSHPRERSTGGANEWVNEGPLQRRAEVIAGNLRAITRKRGLGVRQRENLQ